VSRLAVVFAVSAGIAAVLALVVTGDARAKFSLHSIVVPVGPHVGEPVSVTIWTGSPDGRGAHLRLLAIAPGVPLIPALKLWIRGKLVPPRGFEIRMAQHPQSWRATVRFPRRGVWLLVVPNWGASGFAYQPPLVRRIQVRPKIASR
jgi:hypothetical protein